MELVNVSELVDQLFKRYRRPDGKEYTYQEVSTALGGEIDISTISKIRSGVISNPGRKALLLLCQFFQIPASYFFPELEMFAPRDTTPTPEQQLEAAFRSMGFPADVQEHLVGVARAFKKQLDAKQPLSSEQEEE
jgi:transcriptional regulator with XRE-family HTH domain